MTKKFHRKTTAFNPLGPAARGEGLLTHSKPSSETLALAGPLPCPFLWGSGLHRHRRAVQTKTQTHGVCWPNGKQLRAEGSVVGIHLDGCFRIVGGPVCAGPRASPGLGNEVQPILTPKAESSCTREADAPIPKWPLNTEDEVHWTPVQ